MDSTVGLAMSIKEIETIVQDLQAQLATALQVGQGADTPAPPPLPGGSAAPLGCLALLARPASSCLMD